MSVYHGIRCDRCGNTRSDSGTDRDTIGVIRQRCKVEGRWLVAVAGIAPKYRRQQGSYDFCPDCVAWWDVEDARPRKEPTR